MSHWAIAMSQKTGKTEPPSAKSRAPGDFSELEQSRQAAHAYFSEAIKALILVNGGSAIASLAFFGQLTQKYPLTSSMIWSVGYSILCFAVATMLPVIAAMTLAFNQLSNRRWRRNLSRGAMIGSMGLFFLGLYFGWDSVKDLGFANVEIQRAN